MTINTHYFEDQGDAYDASQCLDGIKDGDLLVTPNTIGFLFKAWPVVVIGEADAFHEAIGAPEDLEGGKYAESVEAARKAVFATPELIEQTNANLYRD